MRISLSVIGRRLHVQRLHQGGFAAVSGRWAPPCGNPFHRASTDDRIQFTRDWARIFPYCAMQSWTAKGSRRTRGYLARNRSDRLCPRLGCNICSEQDKCIHIQISSSFRGGCPLVVKRHMRNVPPALGSFPDVVFREFNLRCRLTFVNCRRQHVAPLQQTQPEIG